MKKINSFSLLILFVLLLTACESRKGPPAPVSYGYSLPQPSTTPAPLSPGPNLENPHQHNLKPKTIIVGENETLVMIAQKTGVPAYQLIALNNLKKPYALKPGQHLRLTEDAPIKDSFMSEEKFSTETTLEDTGDDMDTAPAILPASKPKRKLTHAEKELIASLQQEKKAMLQETNNLPEQAPPLPSSPNKNSKKQIPSEEVPSVAEADLDQDESIPSPQIEKFPPVQKDVNTSNTKKSPSEAPKFSWPVKGKIISSFGPGQGTLQNDGINIAAPKGTPIIAIEDGVVVYAGNEMQGFGNLILLKHPGGWMSSYGHAAKLLVERGAKVQKGQSIALVGNTGSVNEPQLHFELRNMKQNGKVVNPELYLE